MAIETTDFEAELTKYDDRNGGVAEFATKPIDGDPVETVSIDTKTWQRMGYPHFVTVVVKTQK